MLRFQRLGCPVRLDCTEDSFPIDTRSVMYILGHHFDRLKLKVLQKGIEKLEMFNVSQC